MSLTQAWTLLFRLRPHLLPLPLGSGAESLSPGKGHNWYFPERKAVYSSEFQSVWHFSVLFKALHWEP